MARRNQDVVPDRRLELRIGINVGDIMKDGGDIYGTGVNVAVRLEGLADPGGILISEYAYQQIHDKLEIDLRDRGPQNLKNIDEPVRAYAVYIDAGKSVPSDAPKPISPPRWRVVAAAAVIAGLVGALAWQSTRPPTVEAAVVENMAFPLPDKPSIAVLAFKNLSTADDELLADSFSEDILTSLSKLSGLFVISRTTTFTYKGTNATAKQIAEDLGIQYVLEGSIQRDGDRIRVNAQLIDAIGGQHVWAERYDRDLTDLFAVKDDIALKIISNISVELMEGGRDRVLSRETENLEAWLLYQKGRSELLKGSKDSIELSKNLLGRAFESDPTFVSALTTLGVVYRFEGQVGLTETPRVSFARALEIFDQALEMEPDHAYTHAAKALYYSALGIVDLALEFGKRGVELDPNDYVTHAAFARALHLSGSPQEAVREGRLAVRLSPVAPNWVMLWLADSMIYAGNYEEALAIPGKILGQHEISAFNEWWARLVLARALNGLGRIESGREQMALAIELFPGRSTIVVRREAGRVFVDREYADELIETYRRWGCTNWVPSGPWTFKRFYANPI